MICVLVTRYGVFVRPERHGVPDLLVPIAPINHEGTSDVQTRRLQRARSDISQQAARRSFGAPYAQGIEVGRGERCPGGKSDDGRLRSGPVRNRRGRWGGFPLIAWSGLRRRLLRMDHLGRHNGHQTQHEQADSSRRKSRQLCITHTPLLAFAMTGFSVIPGLLVIVAATASIHNRRDPTLVMSPGTPRRQVMTVILIAWISLVKCFTPERDSPSFLSAAVARRAVGTPAAAHVAAACFAPPAPGTGILFCLRKSPRFFSRRQTSASQWPSWATISL